MSKIRQIAVIGAGKGLNTLVNFLFLPYLSRALSYQDYGSYGQTILIITFLASLLSFGLPQIIYVFFNSSDVKKVISASLTATTVLSLFGLLSVLLFHQKLAVYFDNPALSMLLQLYAISLLITLPYQVLNSYLIFNHLVKVSAAAAIVSNLIKVILVFIAIQYYSSVYLAIGGILVSQLIQLMICTAYAWRDLNIKINFSLLFDILKNGLPIGLTGILGSGILYSDGLMVSKMLGIESYAIYRNGAIEVPFIATIYSSIAAIVLPEVARLFNGEKFKEIFKLKKKVIMNTIFITYPILVFLLLNSSEIILVYLGEKYASSAIIFSVFNLTLLIRINDYSDILIAAKKSRHILVFYLLTFILNIVLNLLFIKFFGSVGAALATVMSIGVLAFVQLRKSMKILNQKLTDLFEWNKILHMLIFSFGIGFLLKWLAELLTDHPVGSITIGLLFFPLVFGYLYKMNFYSKQISTELLKKIKFLNRWV